MTFKIPFIIVISLSTSDPYFLIFQMIWSIFHVSLCLQNFLLGDLFQGEAIFQPLEGHLFSISYWQSVGGAMMQLSCGFFFFNVRVIYFLKTNKFEGILCLFQMFQQDFLILVTIKLFQLLVSCI